jgi:hypothetical protein
MTKMKLYRASDGVHWGVEVGAPASSNAMVVFHHPDGSTSRKDRYAWFISNGPEARSVTGRLSPQQVLESLDDRAIAMLFRRSMPVSTAHAPGNVATNPAV